MSSKPPRAIRTLMLLVIFAVVMLAMLGTEPVRAEESSEGLEIQLAYFYPKFRCISCEAVDGFAQQVAAEYTEYGPEGIPYERLSIEDPANADRVERYGVVSSSLFIVDPAGGDARELKQVWFLWEDEQACKDYIRGEIDAYLAGESGEQGAGNPWAGVPLLAAFALGLLGSISPCAIGTNVTALAYICRSADDKKKTVISGSMYTAGRAVSYVLLGIVLVYLGISVTGLARFLRDTQYILGPLFILSGLVMLDVLKLKLFRGKFTALVWKKLPADRWWSSFFMGTLFALVFCPYNAILFFGILIPLAIKTIAGGVTLPLAYALGTGLPVLALAMLFSLGASRAWKSAERMQTFEKWARRVTAVAFLGAGIYYVIMWIF